MIGQSSTQITRDQGNYVEKVLSQEPMEVCDEVRLMFLK
jgi:hypothetical protein